MPRNSDKPRTPRVAPAEKTERLREIASMMAAGLWERGKTAEVLAERWGLQVVTVECMAAEASRWVTIVTGDREKLVDLVVTRLLTILEENGRDRVAAARTLLEACGALRQRHELAVADKLSEREVASRAVAELMADPQHRALVEAEIRKEGQ